MSLLSINLTEWGTCDPETEPRLRNYFLGAHPSTQGLAKALSEAGILQVQELRGGLSLTASSYVGRIELGTLEVTVQPKITGIQLAVLLRYAYGLRELRLFSQAQYGGQENTFEDLLISQLLAEGQELVSRGLHRKYLRRDTDLLSPRGRVDMRRMACRGGIDMATLPCTHHPRLENCLVNQVLLSGIRFAAGLSSDVRLRSQLRALAKILQNTVTEARLDDDTLRTLARQSDRLSAAYTPAITIIRILLAGHGTTLCGDDRTQRLSGFMFDMNRFFQKLLSRFLRDHFSGCLLRDECSLRGMMAYVGGRNPLNRRAPQPRPDFAVVNEQRVVAILDAKYRDLWSTSLPREMLYQLAIYALGQRACRIATILYPTLDPAAKESWIAITDPLGGSNRARVVLRPVDLNRLADMVSAPNTTLAARAKSALARWLVFGEEPHGYGAQA